ncbi:hypothetical protein Tco_1372863 [Tanacetum coccineum]
MSNLKKCLSDESLVIPLEELRVDDKLHFVEKLVEVMDHEIKQLKRSRISITKVRWNSKRGTDIKEMDKIKAKTDKNEHENGKSAQEPGVGNQDKSKAQIHGLKFKGQD